MPLLASATICPTHVFMEIKLTFGGQQISLEDKTVKTIILDAIRSMYGIVGGAGYDVDVLSLTAPDNIAILRIKSDTVVPVWAALTLQSSYDSKPVTIDILQVSPFLNDLACPGYV